MYANIYVDLDQRISFKLLIFNSTKMEDKHRIAIINPEKCKPKRCKQECKKSCPVNKT